MDLKNGDMAYIYSVKLLAIAQWSEMCWIGTPGVYTGFRSETACRRVENIAIQQSICVIAVNIKDGRVRWMKAQPRRVGKSRCLCQGSESARLAARSEHERKSSKYARIASNNDLK